MGMRISLADMQVIKNAMVEDYSGYQNSELLREVLSAKVQAIMETWGDHGIVGIDIQAVADGSTVKLLIVPPPGESLEIELA